MDLIYPMVLQENTKPNTLKQGLVTKTLPLPIVNPTWQWQNMPPLPHLSPNTWRDQLPQFLSLSQPTGYKTWYNWMQVSLLVTRKMSLIPPNSLLDWCWEPILSMICPVLVLIQMLQFLSLVLMEEGDWVAMEGDSTPQITTRGHLVHSVGLKHHPHGDLKGSLLKIVSR